MPEASMFVSITEARRIVGVITGKSTGSIVLDTPADKVATGQGRGQGWAGEPPAEILHGAGFADPEAEPSLSAEVAYRGRAGPSDDRKASRDAKPRTVQTPPNSSASVTTTLPVFVVAIGEGEQGQLVTDRRAEASGWALVRYATGIEEVELTSLRIVAIE